MRPSLEINTKLYLTVTPRAVVAGERTEDREEGGEGLTESGSLVVRTQRAVAGVVLAGGETAASDEEGGHQ